MPPPVTKATSWELSILLFDLVEKVLLKIFLMNLFIMFILLGYPCLISAQSTMPYA